MCLRSAVLCSAMLCYACLCIWLNIVFVITMCEHNIDFQQQMNKMQSNKKPSSILTPTSMLTHAYVSSISNWIVTYSHMCFAVYSDQCYKTIVMLTIVQMAILIAEYTITIKLLCGYFWCRLKLLKKSICAQVCYRLHLKSYLIYCDHLSPSPLPQPHYCFIYVMEFD